MTKSDLSRLIFIDSSVNTHGDHAKVLVPPHPFGAVKSERIALTLISFCARRNWYNVNATNNTFYLYQNNVHYEVQIPPGVYSDFTGAGGLGGALEAAMLGVIGGMDQIALVAVVFDATTRRFTITFNNNGAHPVTIRCYDCKTGVAPANVSPQGFYNDSYELLGARPIRDPTDAVDSLAGAVADTLVSYYPASLNTLDAIYLRLNLQTNNFSTTSMDRNLVNTERLVESSLFARIPIERAAFDLVHETVQFEDSGGDLYQTFLAQKSLDNFEIRVTDAKGRPLAEAHTLQSDLGLMQFTAVLRYDIFVAPPVASNVRVVD